VIAHGSIRLTDLGRIDSSATASGVAGNVNVTAAKTLQMESGSSVRTRSSNSQAGNVSLTAHDIVMTDNRTKRDSVAVAASKDNPDITRVTAQSAAKTGGNIALNAVDRVTVRDSIITARAALQPAAGQQAAKITIDPASITLRNSIIDGRIDEKVNGTGDVPVDIDPRASFIRSADSKILSDTISAPVEVDIAGSLTRLPDAVGDASAKLSEQCGLRVGGQTSSFIATGRGGAPIRPTGYAPDFAFTDTSPRKRAAVHVQ
jgi:hypothetical protein